jgi:hypothetical protein
VTQEADYPASPDVRRCGKCDGLGKVATGSRVPKWTTISCGDCRGHGFVPPPGMVANGSGPPERVVVAVGAGDQSGPPADADPWGSPRLLPDGQENPNYGRMPQYKAAELP